MGDDGQIILLSALVACLCLLGVIACVAAIDSTLYEGRGGLSDGGMDNVVWAQHSALRRAAFYGSAYPWDGRSDAASRFKSEAGPSLDSLAVELLKHGTVYRFLLNDSLAGGYVATHPGNGTMNIDGVIVEPAGGSARVCGCAYDVLVYDGFTTYRASRVATFD